MADSLDNHSELDVLGEVFDVTPSDEWRKVRQSIVGRLYAQGKDIDPDSNLLPIINYVFDNYNGFILHRQWQISENNFAWSYLATRQDLKIIHLYRTNLFKQYLSAKLAETTSVWHLPSVEGQCPEWRPITIDIDHCLKIMRQRQIFFNWSRHLFRDNASITVSYESIEDNIHRVLSYCQGFLGVALEQLPVNFRKLTCKHPKDLIANFEDVKKRLSSSEFRYLVSDL